MNEPIVQKYDPDEFDPIVVNETKVRWQLVVIGVLVCFSIYFFGRVTFDSPVVRAYQPGNWLDTGGILDGLHWVLAFIGFAFLALVLAVVCKRFLVAASLVIFYCGLLFLPNLVKTTSDKLDPLPRFEAELPAYQQALQTGNPFGAQFSEESDDRRLTYWRWITYGIDNAVGIIYDPKDKLAIFGDGMAFREQAHGGMFRIRKLKSCWYFVQHS
jgi:hypothetical protein